MKYESTNTHQVLSAIDNARQSFFTLEKSGKNSFFKNRKGEPHAYSTLSDIFDATMEALYEHKLSVNYQTKLLETDNGILNILTTTISHLPSGQFISSVSNLGNHVKSQELGSAITYLRRYHIQAMLNLEADFEDDGNLSSGNTNGESDINDKKDKNMPSRKYVGYDKEGKANKYSSDFNTYLKNLNVKEMKQHFAWGASTVIQLQDIIGWAKELPAEHKKHINNIVKKCEAQIKLIEGE